MTRSVRFFLLVMLYGAVLFGCTLKTEPFPQPPQGYADLLEAYSSERRWTSVNRSTEMLTIEFYKWKTVSFNCSSFVVEDCTESEPGIVGLGMDDTWMVRGRSTGIRKTDPGDTSTDVPVYIYWNESALTVCTSSGNRISLGYVNPEFEATLPMINIVTEGGRAITSKEDYVEGKLTISNPDNKYGFADGFSADMKIRGRGNSTWSMPKKPWKIKFDEKQNIFNMSTDKEWCLLANYADKTLIRNIVAMEISRICGFRWTPRMVSVEVTLNGKYQGVYTFCEHKKVSKERVNIDTERGDVLLEIEEQMDEPVCWWTEQDVPMMFSEPSEPLQEQISQTKMLVRNFETALKEGNFNALGKYADLESFANNFIIQELTKNIDGNLRKSSFITLEKGGRMEMYFVWDFDLSQGNADYFEPSTGKTPRGWWVKEYGARGRNTGWYWRLFKLEEFRKLVQARWNKLYPELRKIPDYIDRQSRIIGTEAIARDQKVWPYSQYRSVNWWNASHTFTTYEAELNYYKDFYSERLEWMNDAINEL